MASNLGDLGTNVADYGFSSRYLSAIYRWIDEAQKYIVKNSRIRTDTTSTTITTTAGDSTYSLPSNFSRIIDISYPPENDVLDEIDSQIVLDELITDRGRPTRFLIVADQITFYPIPDAVYNFTLNYRKLPATLSINTDVPEIPTDYYYLLEEYALSKAYGREGDLAKAQYHKAEFDNGFAAMKNEINQADTSRPKQLPGAWSNFEQ